MRVNERPFHICHVVASINIETGGPAVSVTRLASALVQRGARSSLCSLDYARHGPQVAAKGVEMVTCRAHCVAQHFRGYSRDAEKMWKRHVASGVDVVHGHGLWMFPNLYARRAARAAERPLVISPRGMLEPWALRRGRWKKRCAWLLFERANLQSAALFHATSGAESRSIRESGFRQPIAVIPNGVDLPTADRVPRACLESRFPELYERRWLLFLSRLHPKKGVIETLQAWAAVRNDFPAWHLILAGPDLDGYRATVEAEIDRLKLEGRVTLPGPLSGQYKEAAFNGAELFVLPTHSENFGLVIAEALAHGLPVITTHAAPWGGLQAHDCGWWIPAGELATTLNTALALPPEILETMGAKGKAWIAADFTWEVAARQIRETYEWIIQQGAPPPWVV
jgi:glycosyltransferase involved in cell wall biosynthesis